MTKPTPSPSAETLENSSLLDRLRSETRAAHERLEQLLGLPASVPEHVRRLERFYGFHVPWEARVWRLLAPFGPALGDRRKVALLEQDLAHFGLTEDRLRGLPRCDRLPPLRDVADALGSAYVLEGSTLGGQVISRHLERTLGLADGRGYAYFRSYGQRDVGRMWQAFRAVLLAHSSPEVDDAIVRSATASFERLYDWFSHDDRFSHAPTSETP